MKLSALRSLFPPLTSISDILAILSKVTNLSKTKLLSMDEFALNEQQWTGLRQAVSEYQSGRPLPYILGEWEFFGLPFYVTPDVLIPRPETEMIIEEVLKWVPTFEKKPLKFIDIGTGSGIIPISIAIRFPYAEFWGSDISQKALEVASMNVNRHGVQNQVHLIWGDLFDAEELNQQNFSVLTANLPYIPTQTLHQLDIFGKEPTLALDGGTDGLLLIKRLIHQISFHNPPLKLILLEMENRQGDALLQIAREAFPNANVSVLKDLGSHDRLLRIINSN